MDIKQETKQEPQQIHMRFDAGIYQRVREYATERHWTIRTAMEQLILDSLGDRAQPAAGSQGLTLTKTPEMPQHEEGGGDEPA